jgi:excisionase family DNA binding protein
MRTATPADSTNRPAAKYTMIDAARRTNDEPRRLVRTVTEASTILGISRAHGYRLISRGELRAIRLGRRILVPDKAIEDLLADTD